MGQLSAPVIALSPQQRETLAAIVRKRTNPQQVVLRAKIILGAAQGQGRRAPARVLGVGRDVVHRWRRRWEVRSAIADVQARLADAPRPGAPAPYTPAQICAIVALACEGPALSGRPITHWTQQELAAEAGQAGAGGDDLAALGRAFFKKKRPSARIGCRGGSIRKKMLGLRSNARISVRPTPKRPRAPRRGK